MRAEMDVARGRFVFYRRVGDVVYFKITNPDAHHKNGHRLSDYKILDEDEDTGKFV